MLYEENKTKKIVAVSVFFAVLITVAIIYQQKTIMSLKKEIAGLNNGSSNILQHSGINSPTTVQTVKKNLENLTKEVQGKIISKSDNLLKIKADVVDFSKLSQLTEQQLDQAISSFPKTKKDLDVIVSDKTQFENMTMKDLKEGMSILVKSSDLIYKSTSLNALSISAVAAEGETPPKNLSVKGQIEELKTFTGTIEEIGDNYLKVSTHLVDLTNITNFDNFDARTAPRVEKSFKVLTNDKTDYAGKGRGDLQTGVPYNFYSPVPIYSVNEFTATKIEPFQ